MQANELITGDWVLIKRTPSCEYPYKICSIKNYSILGEDYADWIEVEAGEEINLEDIKPIPLTAEILEKNGFHKQKWNDLVTDFVFATDLKQSPQTVIQFTFYSKEIEGVRSLLKMWTKSKFGHGQNDVHLCGIYYVHELQHALRLCGIDKEIVL